MKLYRNAGCFSLCFLALLSLQMLSSAEIVRGPYLCDVTKTSIAISWETSNPGSSAVEYATEAQYIASGGGYAERIEDPTKVKRHTIILTGLKPSTRYHYRVISGDEASEDNTFHTAVGWGEPFTVAVYGDTRSDPNAHLSVVREMIHHKPDLVLNTGDLVGDGRVLSQWDVFFDTAKDLMKTTPYYPTLGNHERNAQHYYDLFHLPVGGGRENEQWYSFDYGNTHFICLDSNNRFSPDQLSWLEEDLARTAGRTQWIFVVFHHPPYSSGRHGGAFNSMMTWIALFEKYGVDMVFSGHDHIYERSLHNGICYIVAGGGGAPLYPVNVKPNPFQVYAESTYHFCKLHIDGARIIFEMIRSDGTVGDTMDITTEPVVGMVPFDKLPSIWGKIKRF